MNWKHGRDAHLRVASGNPELILKADDGRRGADVGKHQPGGVMPEGEWRRDVPTTSGEALGRADNSSHVPTTLGDAGSTTTVT